MRTSKSILVCCLSLLASCISMTPPVVSTAPPSTAVAPVTQAPDVQLAPQKLGAPISSFADETSLHWTGTKLAIKSPGTVLPLAGGTMTGQLILTGGAAKGLYFDSYSATGYRLERDGGGLALGAEDGAALAFYTGSTLLAQFTGQGLTLEGALSTRGTNTAAGTTGAQTIDKAMGSVNFAAGATSLVVTDSLCSAATTLVSPVLLTNDATAVLGATTVADGSFTLRLKTAPTAETRVGFILTIMR